MLGDSVGRDEYIDQKHGRFRKIRRRGGLEGGLNWNRFRRICTEYTLHYSHIKVQRSINQ
jgi:hypothetical protein